MLFQCCVTSITSLLHILFALIYPFLLYVLHFLYSSSLFPVFSYDFCLLFFKCLRPYSFFYLLFVVSWLMCFPVSYITLFRQRHLLTYLHPLRSSFISYLILYIHLNYVSMLFHGLFPGLFFYEMFWIEHY